MIKVALRADASVEIGLGHITRCLALATEVRRRGADVRFVCRSLPGDASHLLERAGFVVEWLPASGSSTATSYPWSAIPPQIDAEQTAEVLRHADWLVVDHYGLGVEYETALRPIAQRLLAIDDLPGRPHDVDLFLDQNLLATDRGVLLPKHSRQLLGPQFALLRSEFARGHAERSFDDASRQRLLIFFGGGRHSTAPLVAALAERLSETAVDVVVMGSSPDVTLLKELAERRDNVNLHVDTDQMARLMRSSVLMVGAAGSTSWERCATGLPALTVSVAANQEPIARALRQAGVSLHLGVVQEVTPGHAAAMAARLLRCPILLSRMSARARRLCDGRGAERVADALDDLAA